jgi:diguanylate cyclase (GGDEF)-like protein/hemerythrin-like metal-binding protein/PAS domain S-box-containing protein
MVKASLRIAVVWLLGWLLGSGLIVAAPLGHITLQLKWQHQFQFAGYYAAQQLGYYHDAGLEVDLLEATPKLDPIEEVVEGRAQYGVGNSSLLMARYRGKPVVVLAVIFQHSPLILAARSESGIQSIPALIGKRVMFEVHSEEVLAYLKREGVPESTMHIQPFTFGEMDLVSGKVDAQTAYLTVEPFFWDRAKLRYTIFTPRSAGIDFYGDNLFTSEAELTQHPERVKAFRAASLKGWQYAMQHPEALVTFMMSKFGGRLNRDQLLFEARQMVPLIQFPSVGMGYMYEARWQQIADADADLGLLPKALPLDGFLYDPEADVRHGQQKWLRFALTAIGISGLLFAAILGILRLNRRLRREVKERTAMAASLQENERKFRFIAEHAADVIWTMDLATRRFTYISPSVYQLRGYTAEEAMAQTMSERLTPESWARLEGILAEALASWDQGDFASSQRVVEVDQPHKDGHIVSTEVVTTLHADGTGKVLSVLGVSRNVTARKMAERQLQQAVKSLEELASTDLLTGAWNRRRFDEAVKGEMHRSRRYGHALSLLLLDIDHFKRVNDTHGHHMGDLVLQEMVECVRKVLRESDSLTRWGGEEFIVLMPNTGLSGATLLADRIRFSINLHEFTGLGRVTASLGVAEYLPEASLESWVDRADQAMYQAKKLGRNRVEVDPIRPVEGLADAEEGGAFLKLVWRDTFLSGHPVVDAQHESLFRLANELLDAAIAAHPKAELFSLIHRLFADVSQHFHDEELILAELCYVGLKRHALIHASLLTKARDLATAFEADQVTVGHLFQFLAQDVVSEHMLKADREYFPLTARQKPTPS